MMNRAFAFVCLASCYFIAGCGLPTLNLHEAIDLHRASFRDKLADRTDLAKEFLTCTKQAYDERRSPVPKEASPSLNSSPDGDRAIEHSHLAPIRALIEKVKAKRPSQADSLAILEDLVRDWTNASQGRLDLSKLKNVVGVIKQWHGHLDFDEDALSQDSSRLSQLLLAYNTAYFGDLRYITEPTVSGMGIRAVTKVTSSGFTDRNGNTWLFPGLSVNVVNQAGKPIAVSAIHLDSQRISADLTRLFLEAFFDAAFREPAVRGATALQIQWKESGQPYPVFDADHASIQLEALARITRDALRAEAAVTSLVGKAVRGGSVFSTQNETVAATLETAAGVIAKKLVEHDGFCYYEVMTSRP
jgi:hypothetical protein